MSDSTENSKQIITVGDQPTTKDELGFTPYVIAMAEFLTHKDTKPPLTISIEGEWGSGKSSFMKQLEAEVKRKSKELDKEDLKKVWQKIKKDRIIFSDVSDIYELLRLRFKQETKTIWFNAWRHEKSESLWAAFTLSFLDQLSNNRNLSDFVINIFYGFKLFISGFKFIGKPLKAIQALIKFVLIIYTIVIIIVVSWNVWLERIPQLSKILADIVKTDSNLNGWFNILFSGGLVGGSLLAIRNLLGIIGDLIGSPKIDFTQYFQHRNYEKQVAFVEKFHEDFSKIVDSYVGKDQKIYVFIDDIDRCELDKSADLLQALNMMISNDPKIIFILGMDREKVAAAISFKQRDVIPFLASAIAKKQTEENEDEKLSKKVDYGFSFLEKFVQLSFSVPTPSQKTLDSFVEKILETKTSPEKREKYFFWIPYSLIVEVFDCPERFKDVKHLLRKFREKFKDRIPLQKEEVEKTEPEKSSVLEQNPESQETETSSPDLPIFPIIEKDLDSQNFAQVIEMVAPFFDYNPRRIKQYINLLRLRIYIAYYSIGVTFAEREIITTEQIGKFTAITLRYPRLLLELKNNYQLLAELEKNAVDKSIQSNNSIRLGLKSTPKNKETGNANYWLKNYPKIQQLLCSEMTLNNEQKSGKKYIFENGSIQKLLEVLPPQQSLPSKYFKLREFLAAKKWEEADYETYKVILQVAGREEQRYLEEEDVEKFPCTELYIVDKLWVKYSDNKFGFSVQKKIIRDLGFESYKKENYKEVWKLFIAEVGWDDKVNYENTPNQGHLPYIVLWERKWVDFWLFSRAETCRL